MVKLIKFVDLYCIIIISLVILDHYKDNFGIDSKRA